MDAFARSYWQVLFALVGHTHQSRGTKAVGHKKSLCVVRLKFVWGKNNKRVQYLSKCFHNGKR